jgi:adenosylcobinamide kinase / adenosylcobinamide-phosphate guanylyltransferase
MSRPLVVILGGTRSGKSRLGRRRATELADGGPVTYIATAVAGVDPELDERIASHRSDRPAEWTTIEAGREVVAAVHDAAPDTTILLDGLTLWISLLLDGARPSVQDLIDHDIRDLRAALADHPGPAVVVSDEVGLGIVPLDPMTRAFRDVVGIAHQQLVDDADEAWLTIAGRAVPLAGEPIR